MTITGPDVAEILLEVPPAIPPQPRETAKPQHINVLTSLRFVAALAVVIHHYLMWRDSALAERTNAGATAVCFFFILSGFILTYSYFDWFTGNVGRYKDFMRARFARIFPIYFVALLLATPIVIYFLYKGNYVNYGYVQFPSKKTLLLSWLANLFLLQTYVPALSYLPFSFGLTFPSPGTQRMMYIYMWNAVSWSLCVEAFFYLIFPFFARYVLTKFKRVSSLFILVVTLLVGQFTIYCLTYYFIHRDVSSKVFEQRTFIVLYVSPFMRVWEFLIGCCIGLLFIKYTRGKLTTGYLWRLVSNKLLRNILIGTLLTLILSITFIELPAKGSVWELIFYLKMYVVYTPIFALLILAFAAGPTFLSRILQQRWFILLGEASYSLYLIHLIPINIIESKQWQKSIGLPLILLLILGSVVASIILFKFIEVPARRFIRSGSFKP